MNPFNRLLIGLVCALSASEPLCAAATERTVIRQSEVRFYGAEPRPIGTIDFSSSVSGSRRIGPWDLRTDELEGSGRLLFNEDGGISGDAAERRFQRAPAAGRTCTTHDNLTVCR